MLRSLERIRITKQAVETIGIRISGWILSSYVISVSISYISIDLYHDRESKWVTMSSTLTLFNNLSGGRLDLRWPGALDM